MPWMSCSGRVETEILSLGECVACFFLHSSGCRKSSASFARPNPAMFCSQNAFFGGHFHVSVCRADAPGISLRLPQAYERSQDFDHVH
jgi:hypothetical protein